MAAKKIEELESIRGVAALMIVFYHMPVWHPGLNGLNFVKNCYLMVNLFFVLSGFVISLNYVDRIRSVSELVKFQLLRLGRLYPIHLLFLGLFLLLEVSKWLTARKLHMTLPNNQPFSTNSEGAFFEQVFLVQALGTKNAYTFNIPSWSISVEFYMYLAFALVCLIGLVVKWRSVVFAALGIGCTLMIVIFGPDGAGTFAPLLQCGAGFFIGCTTAALSARITRSWSCLWATALIAGLLLFLCFKTQERFDWMVVMISAVMIITLVHAREGVLKTVLRIRPLAYLGLISYSVYMSHGFVLWACTQFVRVVLKRPEVMIGGNSIPQLSLSIACLGYGLVIVMVLLLSSLTFKFVENPSRQKSRQLVLGRRVAINGTDRRDKGKCDVLPMLQAAPLKTAAEHASRQPTHQNLRIARLLRLPNAKSTIAR